MLGLFTLGLFLGAQLVFFLASIVFQPWSAVFILIRSDIGATARVSLSLSSSAASLSSSSASLSSASTSCRRRWCFATFSETSCDKNWKQKNNVWRIAAQNRFQHDWWIPAVLPILISILVTIFVLWCRVMSCLNNKDHILCNKIINNE